MTVLEVVSFSLKMIGDFNFLQYLQNNGDDNEIYNNDKELLIIAYNQAIQTAVGFYPLEYTETLKPTNESIKYSSFKYNPYKIVQVKGDKHAKILPTEILTDSEISVTYYYSPVVSDFSENFIFDSTPLNYLTIAFGVLSEFLIYKGRFEEATMYVDKFINALKNVKITCFSKKLMAREWY